MLLFNEKIGQLENRFDKNFNTSNVTIQLIILLKDNYKRNHFNTSNVTIQPPNRQKEKSVC